MSWISLYKNALIKVAEDSKHQLTSDELSKAEAVLYSYNVRVNPRNHEVSADVIMKEILDLWKLPHTKNWLERAKNTFFSFYRQTVLTYEETLPTLRSLRSLSLKIGILTDVPYGMDRKFVKLDLQPINDYIDVLVTSLDAGYRKPDTRPYKKLTKQLGCKPQEMIFVGNEEKDVKGANEVGMFSVFIDREQSENDFGERLKISSLEQLIPFLEDIQLKKS